MQILTLGINHHTAPIQVREQVAFTPEMIQPALHHLKNHLASVSETDLPEATILSTCNRTELYCAANDEQTQEQSSLLKKTTLEWLAKSRGIDSQELMPHVYVLPQSLAVRHAFRTQILGQLKDAVRSADEAGSLGTYLNQLFQKTFQVAKEVRGTTEIGAHSISMAAAAVRLSERIFESVSEQKVLFIGAGEMINLCATHFAARKPKLMAVANRTLERGQELADQLSEQGLATESLRLSDLPTRLHDFDIVVSCTASTLPIIGLGMVESAVKQRRHRPVVMVDLAVPRDIETEVGKLNDVYLYTVDDLSDIVQAGSDSRQAAVGQAEAIIETRVSHFMHWLETRGTVPLIQDLRQRGEDLRSIELERARKLLAKGEDPQVVLDLLAQGLTNKFLHGSLHALQHAQGEERDALMKILPGLFRSNNSNQ